MKHLRENIPFNGEGTDNPLQYSCLENPMGRGSWWAAVHEVAKSQTRLSDFTFTFHFHALEKEMATHSSVLAWRVPGTGEPGGLLSMESHRVRHDWSNLAAAAADTFKMIHCLIYLLPKRPTIKRANPEDSVLLKTKHMWWITYDLQIVHYSPVGQGHGSWEKCPDFACKQQGRGRLIEDLTTSHKGVCIQVWCNLDGTVQRWMALSLVCEIKRCLLLGRKVMTNLDSIFKKDITLPTKVRLVKAMVFPVVIYGCESWTVKKAECQRIDAFQLWCWGRLLRVPWTSRRSSQSILKEISPGCSLEEMMLKLKLQYFGHLMRRVDSLENTLMLGGIGGWRKRGWQRMRWLDWHHRLDGREFEWTPGVGDGQGGLECCDSWGRKESDTNEWLNWTELNCEYISP